MSQKIQLLLLAVAGLIYFTSFNGYLPVTDPVESNYALTAKEMVQSGDYLSPQIYGKYWFDKPIMIYWLIAGSFNLFGNMGEFAARLPAAIFSVMSVLLAYWFSFKIYRSLAGAMLSSVILATSLQFWILGKMIITDVVLLFFTSASLAAFFLGLYGQQNNRIWYLAAYALAALATLTKGPVGIVLPAIIIFFYIIVKRQWHFFKRIYILPGLAVFLVVAAPWYLIMYNLHGQDFVSGFLGLHNYTRALVSEHPEDNVMYYYLVVFPLSLMPWTGALLLFLKDIKRQLRLPANDYLIVWVLVIIVFYTFMATKYLTYIFPTLFPTAILLGNFLDMLGKKRGKWVWLWISAPAAFLFVVIGFGARYLSEYANLLPIYAVCALALFAVLWVQIKGNYRNLPWVVAFSVIVVSLVLTGSGLKFLVNERSAKSIAALVPPGEIALASYGKYSASMVFYSGQLMPYIGGNEEEINEEKIRSAVWDSKYAMPVETPEEFLAKAENKSRVYILARGKKASQLPNNPLFGSFKLIGENRNMFLFQRE